MRIPFIGQLRSRLVVMVIIISVIIIGYLANIFTLGGQIIKPLSRVFFQAVSLVTPEKVQTGSTEQIEIENELLLQELQELKIKNAVLQTQVEENELLKSQLGFLQNSKFEYVPAAIISRGIDRSVAQVIIDRGSDDGIRPGMAVVFGDGLMLGKISAVKDKISQVRLLSDQLSKVAVSIQNNEQTIGVLEGSFGLSLRTELIPEDVNLEVGQTVVTSGLDELIPPGLIVGEIERIEKKTNDFFQTAYVKPLVQLSEPRTVSVIITLQDD